MKKTLFSVYASRRYKSALVSTLFCLSVLTALSNFSIGQTSTEEKFFYRGINLGPDETSLVIDGNVFHHPNHYAEEHNSFGRLFENQNIALNPSTGANRARMIRSCIYSTKSSTAAFTFYGITSGDYDVYVYVWEDNNPTTFSLQVGRDVVVKNYKSGGKGKWAKLGPFRANAFRRELSISAFGGDGNISGIELWKIEETAPTLERALNLNSSSSLEIDGKNFEGSKTASGFTFTGRTYENQSLPVIPQPDANTAKMLRSCIYSTKNAPAVLTINTALAGDYQVYLYSWEDNYSSPYSLKINNITFVLNDNTGAKGTWKKLGPFLVSAGRDKKIVIEGSGGDLNMSGLEIHLFSFDPDEFSFTSETEKRTPISAFPNPLTDQLKVNLPAAYKGKATFTLTDSYGKVYMKQNRNLDEESVYDINLSSRQLHSGIYILSVKTETREERIRLIKE